MAIPPSDAFRPFATEWTRARSDRGKVPPAARRGCVSLATALLIGPGILAMLGENDGPSMLSYAASGFFLPFILLTRGAAYVVQEMAMTLAAVTGRGYGELVSQRFGRSWAWIWTVDLVATNYITPDHGSHRAAAGDALFRRAGLERGGVLSRWWP